MHKNDHKKITDFTINNFKSIFSKKFQQVLTKKNNKKDYFISYAAVIEDEGFFKRIKNWHFYKSENSKYLNPFCSLLGKEYPSSRKIMMEYIDKLATSKDNINDTLILAGRIIHHIQDMSTPAHVVPIYHGLSSHPIDFPRKKDGFEKFSKDNIDYYLSNLSKEIINTNIQNHSINSDITLIELYDNVANKTLDYLNSDSVNFNITIDSQLEKVSSTLFWIPFDIKDIKNKKTDGWGKYGILNDKFGKTTTVTIDKKEYKICFKDYEHIYIHFITQMVTDTLAVLMYLDKKIFKY